MKKLLCMISPDLIMHLLFAIFFLFAGCSVSFKGTEVEAEGEIVQKYELDKTTLLCSDGGPPTIFEIDL